MTRPRTVAVRVQELRALRRGWASFLDDESGGEIDPLADAILALLRHEPRARRGTVGVQAAGDPEDEAS